MATLTVLETIAIQSTILEAYLIRSDIQAFSLEQPIRAPLHCFSHFLVHMAFGISLKIFQNWNDCRQQF